MQYSEILPSRNDDNKIFNRSNGFLLGQYIIVYVLTHKRNNCNSNLLVIENNLFYNDYKNTQY
jgi:hypothetical protein